MKNQLLLLSALFLSLTVFAQKDQIKSAEKALKSGDFAAAMAAVNEAEGLIAGADQKTTAKYYYLRAKAVYQNGANNDNTAVGQAFNDLLSYEKSTKVKYSSEIQELSNALIQKVAADANDAYNSAQASKDPADFKRSARGFHDIYLLSPVDTTYLDNAALLYRLAKEYETSNECYNELLELGYTGITTLYIATNKETGEDMFFNDAKSRDVQVKLGIGENPREEVKESRRELIFKNLASNQAEMGNLEDALAMIANGRAEFPQSYSLLIDEANIYFKKGDNDMFKQKLEEAIQMNPTEPTLHYNVGVMNMEQGNIEEAVASFEKAIELKPDYADAYNNIGAALIEKTLPIIEEMNNSLSDFDKYDKLQAQQLEIYKEALPYYEKAYELDPNNIATIQTLLGLYTNLEMNEKHDALKEVYDGMR